MVSAPEPSLPPSTSRAGAVTAYRVTPTATSAERLALARTLAPRVSSRSLGPLARILEVAGLGGCRSVVVEHDYTDHDWRSDHGAFWSARHERFDPLTDRLHFFAADVTADDAYDLEGVPPNDYLGYCVLRPTELGPVGRTVLRPPPDMRPRALCTVTETPSLFGNELRVTGVPFMQQDGEMLRCAHAAAWLCHYVGWSRGIISRKLTAELAAMSASGSKHRPMPSSGLNGEQMQRLFGKLELPALFFDVHDLPDTPAPMTEPAGGPMREILDGLRERRRSASPGEPSPEEQRRERLMRVICKYVNSGLPVVVFTRRDREHHAFVIVGWRDDGDGQVTLIACDDQVGPYELLDGAAGRDDLRGDWVSLMVPLPRPVLLTGEAAETRARAIVVLAAARADPTKQEADLAALAPDLETLRGGDVSIRSRLLRGRDLKGLLRADERGRDAVRLLRLARLPEHVWLVELHSRQARRDGRPCVLAELVFDSTSHDLRPAVITSASRTQARDEARLLVDGPGDNTVATGPGHEWESLINPRMLEERAPGDQQVA